MDPFEQEDAEDRKRRTRLLIGGIVGALVIAGALAYFMTRDSKPGAPRKAADPIVTITLPPPPPMPPPPPPPPPKEPPPEQKEEMEKAVVSEDEKPPDNDPAPASAPDLGLGEGTGPGLPSGGGGTGVGGTGPGGRGGNAVNFYASQVRKSLLSATQQNPKIRKGSMNLTVKLWLGHDGQVVRSTVTGEAGPGLKEAMENEVIPNYAASLGAPPPGLKMPISFSVKATRP